MKRTIKVKWGELKVGLIITFAIATLIWASFSGGGTSIFESKVGYRSYFPNVTGLVKGAPVWISGVEVGNISSIEFVNLDSARQIDVKFKVITSIQNMITENSVVKIGTIGLIGDKYLEIVPGSFDKPILEENSYIPSMDPGNLASVFAAGQKAVMEARGLTDNLLELTMKLKNGDGTIGQLFTNDTLYHEMTGMLSALTLLISDMQKSQKRIVASIENISDNLGSVAQKVDSNEGTLGKLIGDPAVYDNLHASTNKVDSILGKINRGDGTAGAIVNDDELYEDIKNLVVRIDNLVKDIEENPRKYFKFSVF